MAGELVPTTIDGIPPTIFDEIGEQATVSHAIDLDVVVPAIVVDERGRSGIGGPP